MSDPSSPGRPPGPRTPTKQAAGGRPGPQPGWVPPPQQQPGWVAPPPPLAQQPGWVPPPQQQPGWVRPVGSLVGANSPQQSGWGRATIERTTAAGLGSARATAAGLGAATASVGATAGLGVAPGLGCAAAMAAARLGPSSSRAGWTPPPPQPGWAAPARPGAGGNRPRHRRVPTSPAPRCARGSYRCLARRRRAVLRRRAQPRHQPSARRRVVADAARQLQVDALG